MMLLKAGSNKVDEHTVRMEAVYTKFEKRRLPRPSHDDVKSSEDEGGDDLVRWRGKSPEAPSLPRW